MLVSAASRGSRGLAVCCFRWLRSTSKLMSTPLMVGATARSAQRGVLSGSGLARVDGARWYDADVEKAHVDDAVPGARGVLAVSASLVVAGAVAASRARGRCRCPRASRRSAPGLLYGRRAVPPAGVTGSEHDLGWPRANRSIAPRSLAWPLARRGSAARRPGFRASTSSARSGARRQRCTRRAPSSSPSVRRRRASPDEGLLIARTGHVAGWRLDGPARGCGAGAAAGPTPGRSAQREGGPPRRAPMRCAGWAIQSAAAKALESALPLAREALRCGLDSTQARYARG